MTDLEPCPFCRCTLLRERNEGRDFWIHCTKCSADGPAESSSDEAVSAWNKRGESS